MASLDIFHQDPFSMMQMTSSIERIPYAPSGLDALNIFNDNPIRTRALAVEERDGALSLIQTSERGTPVQQERRTERRKMRYFEVPRIVQGDTIFANEIEGIREFGQETELMQVQTEVARRVAGPTGLLTNIRLTHENMRLGAVRGQLLDADGTILYDWFDEFGFAGAAPFYFDLAAGTPNSIRPLNNKVIRSMARSSKGLFTAATRVIGLCGDDFYDQYVNHPDVIRTFVNWNDARDIRDGGQGAAFSSFPFGGIEWVNYRGTDDNSTIKIANNEVEFVTDAPGVFERALAPLESFAFVNTPGKEFYSLPIFDKDRDMWWRNELYSYPLFICKRPDVLRKGFSDALGGNTQGGALPVQAP